MERSCKTCKNKTWEYSNYNFPDICIECKFIEVNGEKQPSNWKPLPMTNADRIRAMSDEELAQKLLLFTDLDDRIRYCKDLPECQKALDDDVEIPADRCRSCLLSWLQQPAEVDNG